MLLGFTSMWKTMNLMVLILFTGLHKKTDIWKYLYIVITLLQTHSRTSQYETNSRFLRKENFKSTKVPKMCKDIFVIPSTKEIQGRMKTSIKMFKFPHINTQIIGMLFYFRSLGKCFIFYAWFTNYLFCLNFEMI